MNNDTNQPNHHTDNNYTEKASHLSAKGKSRFRTPKRRRQGKPSNDEAYVPFRQKAMAFFSRNALIITFIVIALTVGFAGRDLWVNTIKSTAARIASPRESADESALYRDVFLPMSDMVIAGKDFEAFLLANNNLSRADWYISFFNTGDQTFINIYPRKSLSLYEKPSVSIRVPIKSKPYAFHAISLNWGSGKTVSIERYPSGNLYYFAEDKEKPLSGFKALDDLVHSWR